MSGTSMALSALSKINSRLKFLYRKRIHLNSKDRKQLSSALIQSNYDYGCNSWYRGLSQSLKNKFQTAQNKTIRFILDYGPRQHLNFSDFKKLGWLNVKNRVDYLTLNLMFNIHNKTAPSYMCDIKRKAHGYNTKTSKIAYDRPSVKSQGLLTFKYVGITLFNNLPIALKNNKKQVRF